MLTTWRFPNDGQCGINSLDVQTDGHNRSSGINVLRNAWRFLGYGDPRSARVWFVGLEEASEFKTLEEIRELQSRESIHCRGCPGERTAVYDIISKIVIGLRDGDFGAGWRSYRDTQLFSQDSDAFQANLYPLGKKSEADWPVLYQKWFGMSREQYYHWQQEETPHRFNHLRRRRKHHGNPLAICFGKGHWDHFRRCFAADGEQPRDVGRFRYYAESRVILTEFFRSTRMSDSEIRKLIRLISRLGLNPFASIGQ